MHYTSRFSIFSEGLLTGINKHQFMEESKESLRVSVAHRLFVASVKLQLPNTTGWGGSSHTNSHTRKSGGDGIFDEDEIFLDPSDEHDLSL